MSSSFNINNTYYSNSTFGLDYFDIINNLIKMILYPKPSTTKSQLKELVKKNSNTRIFTITNVKSNIKTCVCEIFPSSHIKTNKIIIFSHGNGCDIYTFYPYLLELSNSLNVMIVCWDYPQYGLSEGDLHEHTCYQGLSDVIRHYLKLTSKILLIGQSLGTGVVVDYISNNPWSNPVILISPYKSIPKVITQFDLIEFLICKNKFCSYDKITKTTCPIKIFHGHSDNLIPITHSIELYELTPNKSIKPTWFSNTGHNDILDKIDFNEYVQILNMLK